MNPESRLFPLQDLDRVGSIEEIGREPQLRNSCDVVKSDLFLARMTVSVNDVTRNATVVLGAIRAAERVRCSITVFCDVGIAVLVRTVHLSCLPIARRK